MTAAQAEGAHVLCVGNMTIRLCEGASPPPDLARVLAGKAPRAKRRPPPVIIDPSRQLAEYERAMRTGAWAPDLTPARDDENVAGHTVSMPPAKRPLTTGGTTTMSNTATIAKPATSARRRKAAKPAAAKPEQATTPTPTPAPAAKAAPAKREGITALAAAEKVLRRAQGPLQVAEIARRAVALEDFKPTGKTPEASVAARVHVSAKASDGVFVRVSRGVVDVRELNPRGAAKRPNRKTN